MSELTVLPVRFEHHVEPLGIGEPRPRLSWQVQTDVPDWRQAACEVEIAPENGPAWSSGQVETGDSVLVAWHAPPLVSRERRTARVRVWGQRDAKPSTWSDDVVVESGLLRTDDWTAELILPVLPAPSTGGEPAALLRSEFVLDRPVVRARLYATAHGIYEAELNGSVVGDAVLAPGWTSYHHRLRYQTYDVTDLLTQGQNAIGIHLADGWFRGYLGFAGKRNVYGDRTAVLVQLEVEHADGTRTTVPSNGSWRSTLGPLTRADIYNGETYDARLDRPGWSSAGFDDADWTPVEVGDLDRPRLIAPTGPPVRRTQTLAAQAVTASPSGKTLVDFGQNLVGRLRVRLPAAPAGTEITIRHAEVLENGELGTRPLREAAQTDVAILNGNGPRTWEPRFTFHGFRYAEVNGWPGELTTSDLEAVVLHTDMQRIGTFTCSDPDLNRLHENVVWGMRGNFVDVPTDCPQRDERLGWTGDLQVFTPTATFLYDVAGMFRSWLSDLAVDQHQADGVVPLWVPNADITPRGWSGQQVEAGWGDAAVVVPWVLFQRYGDVQVLADHWESMTTWLAVFEGRAGENLDFPMGGFMLGDWLDAAAPDDQPWKSRVPWQLVATAYLARSAQIVSDIAGVLGRDADRDQYARLAQRVAERFRSEYVTPNGRLAYPAQAAYALALEFDLLTADQRRYAGPLLAMQVDADEYRIGTGFLGTPVVCDALTAAGQLDTAYALLLQRECPSWLYPVTMGATTIWERWNSMLPDGSINPGQMTSFNHYALGAVADWMHRILAGLAPAAPGYRRLRVAPRPGGHLSSAAATHESPYGRAEVAWTLDGETFTLDVNVPPNADAEISLPDGSAPVEVGSGQHCFTCAIAMRTPVAKAEPPYVAPP
jgi:alpha-L-rhamnosidase